MKKSNLLKLTVLTAVAVLSGINVYKSQKETKFNALTMANIEALARNEDSGTGGESDKKIYRYEVWHNESCYIYVGGAYAKGKTVTCVSGNEHPVCVKCTL